MNVEIVISQYLKEQGISPKTQGYSILEDAIYRSFQYPNETAKEIFEYLLGKYNLIAEDCVFIDDSEKNLAGAREAGISTILFTGDAEKLKTELK